MNYEVGTQVATYKSSKYRVYEVVSRKIIIFLLITYSVDNVNITYYSDLIGTSK